MSKFSIILQERNTRREVLFTGTKKDLEQQLEDLRGSNIHNGLDAYPEGAQIILLKTTAAAATGEPAAEESLAWFEVMHKRTRQSKAFVLVVNALISTRSSLFEWNVKFRDAMEQVGMVNAVSQYLAVVIQAQEENNLIARLIDMGRFENVADKEQAGARVENLPAEIDALTSDLMAIIDSLKEDLLSARGLNSQMGSPIDVAARQMLLVAKSRILLDMKKHLALLMRAL